jgi:hypothetical protein
MRQLKHFPKLVLISLAAGVASLLLLVLSVIFVGGALRDGQETNARLKAEQSDITTKLSTSSGDYKFAMDNREKFEAVIKSERLIPHTRVNAAQQFEALAKQRGLETLNYSFNAAAEQSLATVKSQPTTGGYKVSVETVDLKFGAALDTSIYGFLLDLNDDFPGAAVVQSFTLSRNPTVDDSTLDRLSHGLSSGLVNGEAKVIWRTAQAIEEAKKQ